MQQATSDAYAQEVAIGSTAISVRCDAHRAITFTAKGGKR